MDVAGRGRILFWEGASLWIMEALPTRGGTINSTDYHSHHAIQITLSLGGRFELRTIEATISSAAAVAPDVEHIFEAEGLLAMVFVEPESLQGRSIANLLFQDARLVPVSKEVVADLAGRLRDAYKSFVVDEAVLETLGRSLVDSLAGFSSADLPDPRIQRMIAFAASHLDSPISLSVAAKNAGLSASRARHLFVEQTGLPFRTYLLWLRINRAVGLFSSGSSLTAAAHEAGFSDSAHFSRTFRRMFGLPAASLQIV